MGRINLTTILAWVTLSAALIISFVFGTYQWGRYQTARQEKAQTSRNIAVQARNQMELQSQFKNLTKQIAAPDTTQEDPIFYGQLRRLMETSGVKPISIVPATPTALPTIGTTQIKTNTVKVNATTTPKEASAKDASTKDANGKEKEVGYSLTSLPLNVRPLSTTLTVVGSFANVNRFIRTLYNFRFSGGGLRDSPPRALNINSLQINGVDNVTGQLHATMLLTRFVYKPDAAPKPQTPQVK